MSPARPFPEAPLDRTIPPRRQAAPRHYGAHQYFTRRAWNVVRAYIEHFSRPGEVVLDPFGGAGTTAIEALATGRRAVHVDLSPLACFIARAGALPADVRALEEAGLRALARFERAAAARPSREPWFPRGVACPRSADVDLVEELFTPAQRRSLGLLLEAIDEETRGAAELNLLLRYAFSATLYKCSRTFLSARGRAASRGGSSIFSIYRYKVAKAPVELPVADQFRLRLRRLLAAKRDGAAALGPEAALPGALRCVCGSAQDLRAAGLEDGSVDYVFTDPPYGGLIAYLDLATVFHAWLGLAPPPGAADDEAIEGGDRRHGRAHYLECMSKAAREMRRVLRPGRWLSLVYAHRDLSLWEAVIDLFSSAGFTFRNAVPQPVSVVWSMHKKKRPGSTLAGEIILNFSAENGLRRKSSAAIAREALEAILEIQPVRATQVRAAQ